MTRFELDQNQLTRCCNNCSIICDNEQFLIFKKDVYEDITFYLTRIEPCETILEESRMLRAGNPICKVSLQESVNEKRN